MAHGSGSGGGHGGGGALKEFFLALGLDADSASFAAAETMVHGLELGLEKAFEVAEELADKFVETIHETIEWGESLKTASVILGQSAEQLQLLDYEAKVTNVSSEELRMGFVHLARSMVEARDGGAELQRTFARLGVHTTDSSGKLRDQVDVLEDVAEGIRKMSTQSDRLAAAQAIFGRSGARLLPLLMKGKEGMQELREEAQALGVVLSEEQVEAAAKAGESLKSLDSVVESVKHELAGPFIEALQPVLDGVLDWVKANRALISSKITEWAKRFADGLVGLLEWIRKTGDETGVFNDLLDGLVVAFNVAFAAVSVVASVVEGLVWAFEKLGDTGKTLAAIMLGMWLLSLGPVVIFAAALALVLLGAQDLIYFFEGKRSLIGLIFQGWTKEALNFAQALKSIFPPWLVKLLEARFGGDIDRTISIFGGKEKIPEPVLNALQQGAGGIPGGQFLVNHLFTGPNGPTTTPGRGGGSASTVNNITINPREGQSPKEIADETAKRIKEANDATWREIDFAGQGG